MHQGEEGAVPTKRCWNTREHFATFPDGQVKTFSFFLVVALTMLQIGRVFMCVFIASRIKWSASKSEI